MSHSSVVILIYIVPSWPLLLYSSSSSPPVSTSSTATGAPASTSPRKDSSSPASAQPRQVRRAPQGPQALMPLPCKKAEGLQYNNFKCPECQTQFGGKAELVTHFQQIRAAPNSVSLELSLSLICHTSGSFPLSNLAMELQSVDWVTENHYSGKNSNQRGRLYNLLKQSLACFCRKQPSPLYRLYCINICFHLFLS